MGQVGYFTRIAFANLFFLSGVGERWLKAINGLSANTYTANQFTKDILTSGTEATEALGSFLDFGGDDLPTLVLTATQADLAPPGMPVFGFVGSAVARTAVITSTPNLTFAGNPTSAWPVQITGVEFRLPGVVSPPPPPVAWREYLKVTLSAGGTPDKGVHVGWVFADNYPIAQVLINVT